MIALNHPDRSVR
jgi:hypothetical protein